jgi:hypothetical protein
MLSLALRADEQRFSGFPHHEREAKMKPALRVSRRSFIRRVTGAIAASGALGLISGEAGAWQPPYTGITDHDTGSNSDNAGYGRGNRGASDNDRGPNADPVGRGRRGASGNGRGGATGYSDNDSGPNADPSGQGRRGRNAYTGYSNSDSYDRPGYGRNTRQRLSDGDSGPYADPPGNGRGNTRFRCTDSDSGNGADPGGQGRHCAPR